MGSKVVMGLPKLCNVLSIGHRVIADFPQLFPGDKQLHPLSQIAYLSLQWVDEVFLQVASLTLEPLIKVPLHWSYQDVHVSTDVLKVWIKETGWKHPTTLNPSTYIPPMTMSSTSS